MGHFLSGLRDWLMYYFDPVTQSRWALWAERRGTQWMPDYHYKPLPKTGGEEYYSDPQANGTVVEAFDIESFKPGT